MYNSKFANWRKLNGEMLIRELSEKAQKFYYETQPLDIYCDDNCTNICLKDCAGVTEFDSLEALERDLEASQDEIDRLNAEDEEDEEE